MLYLDGTPMPIQSFPNREIYIDTTILATLNRQKAHTIGLRFEGNDDLIALLLLKGQMDDMGFEHVLLSIPFFPYSTMDHTDGTRPLSLKYIAQMINAMQFDSVEVWEAHSPETAKQLHRIKLRETTVPIAQQALSSIPTEKALVCFPDKGASTRYAGSFPGLRTATFQKQRDFATGNILGMECLDSLDDVGAHTSAIIVDDLCRGGRTFLECGKLLRAAGVGTIILCVTHAENGIFTGSLFESDIIDQVYATDTCLPIGATHARLKLIAAFDGKDGLS